MRDYRNHRVNKKIKINALLSNFKGLKHFAVRFYWLRICNIASSLTIILLVHSITESGYAHRYWVYVAVIIMKNIANLKFERD